MSVTAQLPSSARRVRGLRRITRWCRRGACSPMFSTPAGDHKGAWQALRKAEDAADESLTPDSGVSPWSCPRPRQALYALSVAIQSNNPDAALLAASRADAGWASGEPWVYGTWAQVRFGAGIAHVMLDELDGACEQVSSVMDMPPEFRLATVTNYLIDKDA